MKRPEQPKNGKNLVALNNLEKDEANESIESCSTISESIWHPHGIFQEKTEDSEACLSPESPTETFSSEPLNYDEIDINIRDTAAIPSKIDHTESLQSNTTNEKLKNCMKTLKKAKSLGELLEPCHFFKETGKIQILNETLDKVIFFFVLEIIPKI